MPDHYLRHDCRLCGSENLVKVLELAPTPPANSFVDRTHRHLPQRTYPLDLYLCKNCTHVQLCDVVDPKLLFENYIYVSGTTPEYRRYLQNYAADVIARYGGKSDCEILEIGSNDGTFLKYFQEAGFTVHGVDPARNISEIARHNGIPTTVDFFGKETATRLRKTSHKPHVILANHVFAHIDNLQDVMEGVAALLEPGGFFIFEVSHLLDVVEKLLFDTIYHEHIAYHSVRALQLFLKRYDFELVDVQKVGHQGGSLRSFAQRCGGPRPVDKSVADFLTRERNAGLDIVETYQIYAARLEALKKELGALLHGIKNTNKSIAGFGAPAKATTLMHHFGFDQNLVDFIIDNNPLKQGTYTPGFHIPVLPAIELYNKRPDYTIILAWNFADSIIATHQSYLEQGGRFIVPLPKLTVYEKEQALPGATEKHR